MKRYPLPTDDAVDVRFGQRPGAPRAVAFLVLNGILLSVSIHNLGYE